MTKHNAIVGISTFMIVLIIIASSVGCTVQEDRFDVSGKIIDENTTDILISCAEDIKNIVTDDDSLVINYFDAYIWIITFDENSVPDIMTYVYKFEDKNKASEMVSVREDELQKNRTMNILSSHCIEEYVVITLEDSSFNKVTRDMLENNFNGLIVY